MSTGLALLIAYVLVAIGMLVNYGFYSPVALLLLVAGFGVVVVAHAWAWTRHPFDRRVPKDTWFAAALVALLIAATFKPVAVYGKMPLYDQAYRGWLVVLALLIAAAYLVVRDRAPALRLGVFIAAVTVAIAFRVLMPIASPTPQIDTFTSSQEGSQLVLEGKSPYETPLKTVYRGGQYDLEHYTYLPGNLYLQLVSYRLAGDIRYAYVLAEALVAFALWRLTRRKWGTAVAELAALLFLYHPSGLFVLELSWIDPLILGSFAASLLLRQRKKPYLAAAAYGYMLSLKQTMAFAFVQWFFIERDWRKTLSGLAVGAATFVPFALVDWRSLWDNGVMFNLLLPFRTDALTVFSYLALAFGLRPPLGWTVGVGAVLTVLTALPLRALHPRRAYLFAMTITLFGMFLFGAYAFCNYYYLVSGMLLFLIVLGADGSGSRGTADGARSKGESKGA